MNSTFPGENFTNDDADGELVLIFLTEYRALEQALVRAGFTMSSRSPGNVQPDWVRFARHIERRFNKATSAELREAVDYLLCEPEESELRGEELDDSSAEPLSSPQSDIVRLSELIQETGHKLIHGINFLEEPVYDFEHVMAALMVVAAWSVCDPRVESLLAYVQ